MFKQLIANLRARAGEVRAARNPAAAGSPAEQLARLTADARPLYSYRWGVRDGWTVLDDKIRHYNKQRER